MHTCFIVCKYTHTHTRWPYSKGHIGREGGDRSTSRRVRHNIVPMVIRMCHNNNLIKTSAVHTSYYYHGYRIPGRY